MPVKNLKGAQTNRSSYIYLLISSPIYISHSAAHFSLSLPLDSGCEFSRRFKLCGGGPDLPGVHGERPVVRRAACDHIRRGAQELPGQVRENTVCTDSPNPLSSPTFTRSFSVLQRSHLKCHDPFAGTGTNSTLPDITHDYSHALGWTPCFPSVH